MRKIFFIVFLLISDHLLISAQTNLRGKVIDMHENAIQYVSIRLFLQNSDSLIAGTITDQNGEFSFTKISNIWNTIKIDYIGYKQQIIKLNFDEKVSKLNLGNITLVEDDVFLEEISVKGDKGHIEVKVDRNVVIPDSMALNSSSSALELMAKIPGLEVNPLNNSVTIPGKANVLVLINGFARPINLNTIPSEEIEKIEIITNPVSEYDSEYTGVINIVLKKKDLQGFQGTSSIGYYGNSHNDSYVQAEYGRGKIRLFGTYNIYFRNHSRINETIRISYDESNENYRYYSFSKLDKPLELGHFFQYGLDIFINDKNTLNFTGDNKISISDFKTILNTGSYLNNLITDSLNSLKIFRGKYFQDNYSVFYKRHFDDKENEFNVDLNYYRMQFEEKNTFNESYYWLNRNIVRSENSIDHKESINFKTNYSHEISDIFNLQIGYKFYYLNGKNEFFHNTAIQIFRNKESRHSIYFTAILRLKKFDFQFGVREELTLIDIADSIINKYDDLLPSFGILTRLNEKSHLKFNYIRSLIRPRYWMLKPFVYQLDSLNYSVGNPYLLPSREDNFELTYLLRSGGQYFTTALYYNQSTDLFETKADVDKNISTKYTTNDANGYRIGLKLSGTIKQFKIWKLNFYIETSYSMIKDEIEKNSGYSLRYSISSEIGLPWQTYLNISLSSNGKYYDLQGYTKNHFAITGIYLSKKIFKKQGYIFTGVSYPFNEMEFERYESAYNYNTNQKSTIFFRMYILKLSYNFKTGKKIQTLDRELNMERDH
ncbi:MAG: outer membrane beta-barrel family protein [Bacteroidales bacterium]|nr:outer membrane beta-barrel family protein [Bacteroidales bacterium]